MVDFIVPFDLTLRIKDIEEDELEDYVADIQMAISSIFYSDDENDDHFEVKFCHPKWNRIIKEIYYEE